MTTTASPVATDELLLLVCGPSNRLPGMFSACGITVVLPESGREAAAKESVSRHIGVPLAALQRVDLSTIIPGVTAWLWVSDNPDEPTYNEEVSLLVNFLRQEDLGTDCEFWPVRGNAVFTNTVNDQTVSLTPFQIIEIRERLLHLSELLVQHRGR